MNGLVSIIVFVIIAVISNLASQAMKAEEKKRTPPSPLPPPDDLEQAARTRRIQDEIRRKIAERRGLNLPPEEEAIPADENEPPAAPTIFGRPRTEPLDPFGGPIARPLRELFEPRPPEPPALPIPAMVEPEPLREPVERVVTLSEIKATERTIAMAREAEMTWADATKTASGASAWRKDLRSPADLRRAVVLREVLGPPVALR